MLLGMNWTPHFHFSVRALQLTIIPDKSDIMEVTGFSQLLADLGCYSDFHLEQVEHFSVHPPPARVKSFLNICFTKVEKVKDGHQVLGFETSQV